MQLKKMSFSRNLTLCRILRGASTVGLIFTVALILNLCDTSGIFRTFHSPSISRHQMSGKMVAGSFEEKLKLARKNLPSTNVIFNDTDSDKKQVPHSTKEQDDKEEKIVIEKVSKKGKQQILIKGLPTQKIKEVRNFIAVTTPTLQKKKKMAENTKKIFERRKQRLIESCKGRREYGWANSMQLIAVPEKDFTVCVVQKAGSSSWHRLVYNMRIPNGTWSGDGHAINRNHGLDLSKEIKLNLMKSKNGTRVLTVRHPFARLISGWNNKFHKNHLQFSTKILDSLSGIEDYIGRHEPDNDHIIAFEDFAQYLADRGLERLDPHFKTVEDLCSPCDFPYEYIAKAETSLQHLWWVLDRVGANMRRFVKHTATGSGVDGVERQGADPWDAERKVMSAFFHKVPLQTIEVLLERYKSDFIRFGYTFDKNTFMAGDIVD